MLYFLTSQLKLESLPNRKKRETSCRPNPASARSIWQGEVKRIGSIQEHTFMHWVKQGTMLGTLASAGKSLGAL